MVSIRAPYEYEKTVPQAYVRSKMSRSLVAGFARATRIESRMWPSRSFVLEWHAGHASRLPSGLAASRRRDPECSMEFVKLRKASGCKLVVGGVVQRGGQASKAKRAE
jgi:hypothetical protein